MQGLPKGKGDGFTIGGVMNDDTLLHQESRYLPVRLTQEELIARVDQFSETLRLGKQLAERHELEKARMKAELKDQEAREGREAAIIESRHEDRRVEVHHILEIERNLVREVRQDTGEILRERAATQEELQRSIPGTDRAALSAHNDEGDDGA